MTPTPNATAPPAASPAQPGPRHGRRAHSGDLWILLAVAAVLFVFLYRTEEGRLIDSVAGFLYSPTALLILAVMLIEYLVLKARDRSKFYRLQLQMISNRRREDLSLLRETRDAMAECLEQLGSLRDRFAAELPAADERLGELQVIHGNLARIHEDIQR